MYTLMVNLFQKEGIFYKTSITERAKGSIRQQDYKEHL